MLPLPSFLQNLRRRPTSRGRSEQLLNVGCQYNPKLAVPANPKKVVYGITIQFQCKGHELLMKLAK
jgi:hypothetical protein